MPAFKNHRVRFCVEDYLTDLVRLRRSTEHVAALTLILRQWLGALGVNLNDDTSVGPYLNEITPQDMRNFFYGGKVRRQFYPGVVVHKRTGKEIAGRTFNLRRAYMARFCAEIGRPELMAGVKTMPEAKRKFIVLSPSQMVQMIGDAPDEWTRATLMVAISFGPRAGEIRRLRIQDLDLDRDVVRFTITKSARQEVRYEEEVLAADVRAVILEWLERYTAELSRWRPEMGIHYLSDLLTKGREFYLFPSRRNIAARFDANRRPVAWRYNIRPMLPFKQTHDVVQGALRRLGFSEAEIKYNGVHCPRRSSASAVVDETRDIRLAQKMLHHASQKTTEEYLLWSRDKAMFDDYQRAGGWRAGLQADSHSNVTPIHRREGTASAG